MSKVALKGIATRKLRVVLTALSIVLGVAMVSAAYTFTDTMRNATDSLSSAAYDGTDGVVVAHQSFTTSADDGYARPTVAASELARVKAAPGVAGALGSVDDEAKIIGKDGKPIGDGPYFGTGVDASNPKVTEQLTPFRIKEGRYATAPGEVVLDQATVDKQKLRVGGSVKIQAGGPVRSYRIVGAATFGSVKGLGTATFALFDLRAAQAMYGKQGRYDEILVKAAPGTGAVALRSQLSKQLGASVDVKSAKEQDRFTLSGLRDFIGILQKILIGFGLVSVFVGAFIIFNTLSITVAQRTRELGMLRALGASRRQVLRSVVIEALAIGIVASLTGLFLGLLLAKGLAAVFASGGLSLPASSTVFATRTIVVAPLVGLVVTLVAALSPALKATRVPPVAAMRDTVAEPSHKASRFGIPTFAIGLAMVSAGAFVHGLGGGPRVLLMVPGVLVMFTGVALVAPRLVRPLARVLGAPAARFAGTSGVLARQNTIRNPKRTAVTAAALMIGIALVAFVAVMGKGLKDSATASVTDVTRSNYVLSSHDGYTGVERKIVDAAAHVPGVKVATGVVRDQGKAFGTVSTVAGVDPAGIARVYRFHWKQGSDAQLAALPPDGAIVTKDYASKHHLAADSQFTLQAASGKTLRLRVAGVYEPRKFNPLDFGDITVGRAAFERTFPSRKVAVTFIEASASKAALQKALAAYPDATVFTTAGYAADQVKFIDDISGVFYAMLALSVLISLFGIVNTLVLSVYERTRELGMLRAVGMTRRQVRRMVRHESVVTALIGAVLGTGVGLLLAGLMTGALSDQGVSFSVPVGSLIAFALIAAIAGVIAAALPARKASRLNVLEALQYE